METNVTDEYRTRLAQYQKSLVRWTNLEQILFYSSPASGILFLICVWAVVVPHVLPVWFLVFPLILTFVLASWEDRVSQRKRRTLQNLTFYERGLERLEDRWIGKGSDGASFIDERHPYSTDLDIFGKGSMFELLCTATTQTGEETLARWLTVPATRTEILKRREAVEELRGNPELRERLAAIGPLGPRSGSAPFAAEWAVQPDSLTSLAARVIAPILVVLTIAAAMAWWYGAARQVFLVPVVLQLLFAFQYRDRVKEVAAHVKEVSREFDVVYHALQRLESETFTSTMLRELQSNRGSTIPSAELRKLIGFSELLQQTSKEPYGILSYALLWTSQIAFAVEGWRRRFGPRIQASLAIVGELEALCCIATYAYEHPNDPFPEIVDGTAFLEAIDLKHPLIPEKRGVPNSVRLGGGKPVLFVVSGSNMSGKSTLLRALGTNVVLAQAGAPVRAGSFRLSPLAIGATLRVQDSLEGGISRFHAEIRRLNDIMEIATLRPTLFLLDEILSGTNSHDRAIGAEAVMRGLIDSGAIGLVTTHDLALAKVAAELKPRAENIHFQDHVESGQMVFDYRLHDGPVQKSNALELMRAIGLKV